jgi:putative ABC transport system permease protein
LAGAGALVWLLVCINVANLALVRAADRRRELAVRVALGASRARVVREIAGEMIVLSLIAGALGIGISYAAVGLIRNAVPAGLPRLAELTIDGRLLAFAGALSITTGLICGLLPAWRASAVTSLEALREARSTGIGGRHRVTARAVLTVGQISLALTLFIGSNLLARSFVRLAAVDLGFDPSNLLVVWVHPPSPQYDKPAAAAALYRRLMAATAAVPGVLDAAVTNHVPLVYGWVETRVSTPGRSTSPADIALYKTVSSDYLAVMRLALLKGRWLDESDVNGDDNAVVINDAMARRYWPNDDPLGRAVVIHRASQARPGFGDAMPSVVVGVVKGSRHFGPAVEPPPEVYLPYTREVWPGIALVVRTSKDPATMIPTLQRVLHAEEPGIPLASGADGPVIRTMTSYQSESVASRNYLTWLVGAFAASALMIALIGVYGLTAHTVTRRTPEIGVRIALGARPVDILWLVVGQGLRLSIAGAVVGVAGALGLTRLVSSLLYETSPADLWSFSLATLTLCAAVVLATTIPAKRATQLDPAMAMRAE